MRSHSLLLPALVARQRSDFEQVEQSTRQAAGVAEDLPGPVLERLIARGRATVEA